LATEPAKTAMAVLRWSVTGAAVQSLVLEVDDAAITNAATDADKLGIDCPLGWPDDFLLFLQEHHAGHVVAPQEVAGRDWRRKLAYRATDRAVRERTGLTPLSVAADRIGLTAMRAAGILSRLGPKAGRSIVLVMELSSRSTLPRLFGVGVCPFVRTRAGSGAPRARH
jgi:hypothetical protein